jgi:hypothetical protein
MPSPRFHIPPFGRHRPVAAVLVASAMLGFASCSEDDGLGKRYPVSGTVTYNGKPLEKGLISFVSEDLRNNYGASGAIKDGYYTLSVGGNNDGAQVGKYKVTITAKEDSYAKAKAAFEKESGRADAGFIPQKFLHKAEEESKSLIPTGYGDTRTTTLKAEVKAQSNTIDFPISDADAPPEPPAFTKNAGGRKSHRP